jgi:iron uptake system component EfeO
MTRRPLYFAAAAAVLFAGCSDKNSDSGDSSSVVTVSSTKDGCELSETTVTDGKLTFKVKNDGSETTEFYVYSADGKAVVSEIENIGPGTSRSLAVDLAAGTYTTACKPGMVGDGIRAAFTVSA